MFLPIFVASCAARYTHMVSMKLQNMHPLQEWPVLDTVSLMREVKIVLGICPDTKTFGIRRTYIGVHVMASFQCGHQCNWVRYEPSQLSYSLTPIHFMIQYLFFICHLMWRYTSNRCVGHRVSSSIFNESNSLELPFPASPRYENCFY